MWGRALFFICVLTATESINISKLFCSFNENEGKLLPHQNCHQFYKCTHGVAIPFTCPENLLYNPKTRQCDWPENVNCDGRPFDSRNSKINVDASKAPTICAQPNSDGTLIAHENCNKFYKCFNGKPVVLTCPGNLNYNPQKEQCDWPDNVDCRQKGNESSNNTHDYNAQAQIVCAATNFDGLLIPHENCNHFYKCLYGHPVAQNCPSDLLYNIDVKRCDWPENVDCGDRKSVTKVIPVDSATQGSEEYKEEINYSGTWDAKTVCSSPKAVGVLLPHDSCNKFYMCTAGSPVTFTCSANLVYNTISQLCDWKDHVDCGERTK